MEERQKEQRNALTDIAAGTAHEGQALGTTDLSSIAGGDMIDPEFGLRPSV